VDSAVGHVRPAPWDLPAVRENVARAGYRWPSLGEQYQMREAAADRLVRAGYHEHPASYFAHARAGAEVWRVLNLDQQEQMPQVGIGLGGYARGSRSEAQTTPVPADYLAGVATGRIPFAAVSGIGPRAAVRQAVRMALSTCQPLREDVHRARFPGGSLLDGPYGPVFASLQERGLMDIDRDRGVVRPTALGATLIEAVINAEFG